MTSNPPQILRWQYFKPWGKAHYGWLARHSTNSSMGTDPAWILHSSMFRQRNTDMRKEFSVPHLTEKTHRIPGQSSERGRSNTIVISTFEYSLWAPQRAMLAGSSRALCGVCTSQSASLGPGLPPLHVSIKEMSWPTVKTEAKTMGNIQLVWLIPQLDKHFSVQEQPSVLLK